MKKIEVPNSDIISQWYYSIPGGYSKKLEFYDVYTRGVKAGIDHANEQLADTTNATWQPTPDMVCAFWGGGPQWAHATSVFIYRKTDDGIYVGCINVGGAREFIFTGEHVAELDTIDEIGKPPSYFIARGRSA